MAIIIVRNRTISYFHSIKSKILSVIKQVDDIAQREMCKRMDYVVCVYLQRV